MASMTVDHQIPIGGTYQLIFGSIAFDSSYPTGGEALDPSGVGSIEHLLVPANSGYSFQWDKANQKIKAYTPTTAHTHTENTAGSYTQNATTSANTAAAASEVADTTNLSSLSAVPFVGLVLS